jgi:hypothetical protein
MVATVFRALLLLSSMIGKCMIFVVSKLESVDLQVSSEALKEKVVNNIEISFKDQYCLNKALGTDKRP